MELLSVDTLEEAREKLRAAVRILPVTTGRVALADASGRVLAEDVSACADIPGFRRSTVDGYAVRSADTTGAGARIPVFLAPVGEAVMGAATVLTLVPGQCAYVPTGGMLPDGADAVVMVESCEEFGGGVAFCEAVSPGRNTVSAGEDAGAGALVLTRGTLLGPRELGVLAAVGMAVPLVWLPLKMTIFSTGDELVLPEELPGLGQVRDVNTSVLAALARRSGYAVVRTAVLRDQEGLLQAAVAQAMEEHDIVVISGGSAQGKADATARVIGALASQGVLTHGLAIKPGKPTILGLDTKSRTLLVGLPGHPVSAMMVFERLLGWLWRTETGQPEPRTLPARMARNAPGAAGKLTLQLVTLSEDADGLLATPLFGKSGLITRLAQADGYVEIERNQEGLRTGEVVRVHPL